LKLAANTSRKTSHNIPAMVMGEKINVKLLVKMKFHCYSAIGLNLKTHWLQRLILLEQIISILAY
jgi:hypothetical protein